MYNCKAFVYVNIITISCSIQKHTIRSRHKYWFNLWYLLNNIENEDPCHVQVIFCRVIHIASDTYKLEAKWNRLCDIEALKEQ